MGEARRRKLARQAASAAGNHDPQAKGPTLFKTDRANLHLACRAAEKVAAAKFGAEGVAAISDCAGAVAKVMQGSPQWRAGAGLCLPVARLMADLLHERRFPVRLVYGQAAFRFGDGPGDGVFHCDPDRIIPPAAFEEKPDSWTPPVEHKSGDAPGFRGHIWCEVPLPGSRLSAIVDATTAQFPERARAMELADGVPTRVTWAPAVLVTMTEIATQIPLWQPLQAFSAGSYAYEHTAGGAPPEVDEVEHTWRLTMCRTLLAGGVVIHVDETALAPGQVPAHLETEPAAE